ncbi:MAG: DUF4294 domain-containing protein [Rikenellaceae bacterium]
MKYQILLIFLFIVVLSPCKARSPKRYWHRTVEVERGDTIIHYKMYPVFCFAKGLDKQKHRRLILAVKKVYPIAMLAKEKMAAMEEELAALPTKKEQRQYIKGIYREILDEYTPTIKSMTRTQGRVLIRLIDRETEYTAYEVLHEFRGAFIASFWQGVGRIFGQDLKSEYGSSNEDQIIEQILIYYKAGLL